MFILKKIKIKNFRSFVDEEIFLDDIAVIVGPNEGGKTNTLDAICHLKDRTPFKKDDLRKGSRNFPRGDIEIEYTLSLNKELCPNLIEEIPELAGKDFIILKKGKPEQEPNFNYKLGDTKGVDKIILIKKVSKFKKKFDEQKIKAFGTAVERKWFLKKSSLNLAYKPFPELRKEKIIEVLDDENKINKFLAYKISEELEDNLKVYFWEYKKGMFLKNLVSIQEFIEKRNEFPTLKNLFKIAGWKVSEFSTKLSKSTDSDAAVLLKKVENEINKLISKTWRQHRDLTISIQRTGENLLIHLQEINALTPPELRSDGLRWFLSFLINFRAETKSLGNYIILIDEPGLYLHPRGQKDVLSEIKELSRNNQILYTTHQTFMIDKNHPERVRILKRESIKSGGHDYYFASKITNKIETKDIMLDPLLRESLGFNVSDISPINERNILVEGNFDRNLIYLLNKHFPTIDLEKYSVISCKGAPDIKKFANFLLGNELKIFCLYDSDEIGISSYNDNSENAIPEKMKIHLKLLNDGFSNFETPEDLFSLPCFKEAINEIEELEEFKVDKDKFRMKQLKDFFDSKNIERHERNEIKHKLEDALLEGFKEKLERKEISSGHNLIKLLKSLGDKIK